MMRYFFPETYAAQQIDRVFLNNQDVTARCTLAYLPARPGIHAVGFVDLIDTNDLGLVLMYADGTPRTTRHIGPVRWEQKP